jgi:hypothetical protein
MPLTHLICPVDHQIRPKAACLACARSWQLRVDSSGMRRHCAIPYAVIASVAHSDDQRKGVGISVTQLTQCLRKAWFEAHQDYAMYPLKRWPANHGTAVHDYLERHSRLPPGEFIAETRLWKTLASGIEISGQIDGWWPQQGILIDYKTKDDVPDSAAFRDQLRQTYQLQLQIYRWMLTTGCTIRQAGREIAVQAAVPITQLLLYPVDHKTVSLVTCPLGDLEEIGQFVERAAATVSQSRASAVTRRYDPETHAFCEKVCLFQDLCRTAQKEEA